MRHFELKFTIREDKLATIVSLLTPEVDDLSVTQATKQPRLNGPRYSGAVSPPEKLKWALQHVDKLFTVMEAGKEYRYNDPKLVKAFPDYNPKSFVGGLLSALCRLGKVKRTVKGAYTR